MVSKKNQNFRRFLGFENKKKTKNLFNYAINSFERSNLS